MIIDSHVHIGRWIGDDSIEKIVESALRNNIDISFVSSLGERGYIIYPTVDEFVKANSCVLDAIEKFPNNIKGLCFVNPQHPKESISEIERCVAGGMVGIKLWIAVKASDPSVEPIAEKAIELDVPILQHAWYKMTGNMENESTPYDVAVLAKKYPELKIQMSHLYGAGFRGIADIAPYSNIYVDTSGGEPEAGILEFAVKEMGAERILFGSDAPGRGFAVQLGKVTGANIPEELKEMILWKNAMRIYNIKMEDCFLDE
jgi:uncharacterized protein